MISVLYIILLYVYMTSICILLLIPRYVQLCLLLYLEELVHYIHALDLCEYVLFIFLHIMLRYQYIIDIATTDYFEKKYRFQLDYQLVSAYIHSRIHLKVWLNEITKIFSISTLYKGATWYERESLDFFGIGFVHNTDLRRLLTDYAFEGYPLKKDFPLSGFVEVHYSEFIKRLDYVDIKLIQEFRLFELVSPWGHFFEFQYMDLFNLYRSKKNIPIHLDYLYINKNV